MFIRRSIVIVFLSLIAPTLNQSLAQGLDEDQLMQALSSPDRDVSDYIRDPIRKPVEVLKFLNIRPGMTVMDLYAAGGYYTYVLSKAVGDNGTVYAQNTLRGRQFIEDRQDITQGEALDQKIVRGNLSNVIQIIRPLNSIGLKPGSLDRILVAQTLHDYYNPDPERALDMLLQLKELLKPGGVIGVSDHIGIPGNNNTELHRITIDQAVAVSKQAGFIIEASDILRTTDDDHSRSIFDPRLRRTTDRLLLRLQKPLEP